jgi:hypothetical protein
MDLSSNWGMCRALQVLGPGFGNDESDSLSIFSFYLKLTKLAKIHKKAYFLNSTLFRALKLTGAINLKNLAPLYF